MQTSPEKLFSEEFVWPDNIFGLQIWMRIRLDWSLLYLQFDANRVTQVIGGEGFTQVVLRTYDNSGSMLPAKSAIFKKKKRSIIYILYC